MRTHTLTRWTALLLAGALCAACTTPPPPPPKPKPLPSEQAARAGAPDGEPGKAQAGGGPGAPGSGEGYGAPSANAAEVEEEEVAADGSTRVVSSRGHAPPAAKGAAQGGAGSGGAAMQSSGADGARSAGSFNNGADATPRANHDDPQSPAGIHYQEGATSAGEGNAATDSAARGGAQVGKPTGTRLGVRGGRDERGTSTATPPPAANAAAPVMPSTGIEDDILAQQLREAAEQEKDPTLRDKLWAEYRKYKAGL